MVLSNGGSCLDCPSRTRAARTSATLSDPDNARCPVVCTRSFKALSKRIGMAPETFSDCS